MPAIFDMFVKQYRFTAPKAWRVSFTIRFAIITGTAILLLVLCLDAGEVVDAVAEEYTHEIVQDPTPTEILKVMASPQTLALCAAYFCSFGAELAINSILGAYYLKNFPNLSQIISGRWAAMFGLLNVYSRPLGGIFSDILYKLTNGNLWAKKTLIHGLGIGTGAMCIAIGLTNPKDLHHMVGLVAGLAFFMDAGNGANFALVPHVHPYANGIISGMVGSMGNLGGIIVAIIFRYNGGKLSSHPFTFILSNSS
jgi:NNP family nitrate/nitrite transporter-like MFS transporter